jgi:hypothetical protein
MHSLVETIILGKWYKQFEKFTEFYGKSLQIVLVLSPSFEGKEEYMGQLEGE